MIEATCLVDKLRAASRGAKVFAELDDGSLSYTQLWQLLRQTAGAFDATGIANGDRLLVITRSDRHSIVLFLAALLDGRCPVLLPADTPTARIEAIVRKLRPACVFVDNDLLLALPWLGGLKTVAIGTARAKSSGMLAKLLGERTSAENSFPALLGSVEPRDPVPPSHADALAFIAFTSGTTAAPKGVMTTHRNLFEHLATLVRQFGYDENSRILNNMVLSHNDGLVQGPLLALACGATLLRPLPLDGRTLGPLLESIYALKATHFITVPTILSMAANRAEHDDYFAGPEFRHLISVAAKLDPGVWRLAEQRFGVRVNNIYGLTETVAGGIFCGPGDDSHAVGTVGNAVDMELRIVDEEGDDVADGHVGELWLRGSNATPGYWEDAAATAEIYSGDWLRTGDLARARPDGKVEICGRIKALVVTGGFSVHPDEVDEVLHSHPAVADAASMGIPHPEWGEVMASAVVLAQPASIADLMAWCRARLEPKKVPASIALLDTLPRGRSGKVERGELARLLARSGNVVAAEGYSGPALAKLLELAGAIFNRAPATLSTRDTADTVNGWDSLNHLQLITAVEGAFGIELGMVDVMRIQSLGDLLEAVERERVSA